MTAALILYGSRARGDIHLDSDVDLILAKDGMSLGPPRTTGGISLHLYSKDWLETEAKSGSLFTYHVAHEGLALHDEDGFIDRLRLAFQRKSSYRSEIEIAALVLRMLLEQDWGDNLAARRRYFWALRTIIISNAADHGEFIFASAALERNVGIPDLSTHIDARDTATFSECRLFGEKILKSVHCVPPWSGEELRQKLIALGGIARDSVRVVEEGEAIQASGLAVYI